MPMNKDEEIKLYLNAITTRDPSKRQIKPVDKDAFQLFDDIESESDEDFVVESDELSDDPEIESEGNNSSDAEDTRKTDQDTSSESSKSSNASKTSAENHEKPINDDETEKYAYNVKCTAAAKTKLENVMICMMCLLDISFSDNEIVECDGCGIVVHEDCYKISDNIFLTCDSSDTSTDPWFCDACLTDTKDPRCELCPVEGGVFKRTENNRWVHLLCALYTPGVAFNDIDNLSEITLSELPLKDWSARECSLCTDPFYSRTGICISCDAGLCKNVFHVTCAQREGLLSEPNNEENLDDPYFASCRQHTDKELVKRRRKNWKAAVTRQKLRVEEWSGNDHFKDCRLVRKREFFSGMYCKSLDIAPTPFVPITKVPCFLETNPIAVYMFKKKATILKLPLDILNSQCSSDVKIGNSAVPVFGPDFISYFLDREKKIDETVSEIIRLESFHRDLQISEQNTSHQFNRVVVKKNGILDEYKTNLEELTSKVDIIKMLVKNTELETVINALLSQFEVYGNVGNGANGNGSERSCAGVGGLEKESGLKNETVINECYICKKVSDQHLLIDCDKCHKFIHIGCLDPPLTRMPRKTKLYGWQCSHCVCGTSEDENKTNNVDVNRPRQLRRSSEIRGKYNRIEPISDTKKFTRRLLKKTKQRSMLNKRKRSNMNRQPLIETTVKCEDLIPASNSILKIPVTDMNTNCEVLLPQEDLSKISESFLPCRKSGRSRKRPMTLLDEYETSSKIKKPKISKVLSSKWKKKTKTLTHKRKNFSTRFPVVSLTAMSKSSTRYPITFYPSTETVITSRNSDEVDRVQIGVVAKKPGTLIRDGINISQKSLEKKSILIKCHDDEDDDDIITYI